jgi:hypothetical protein
MFTVRQPGPEFPYLGSSSRARILRAPSLLKRKYPDPGVIYH